MCVYIRVYIYTLTYTLKLLILLIILTLLTYFYLYSLRNTTVQPEQAVVHIVYDEKA